MGTNCSQSAAALRPPLTPMPALGPAHQFRDSRLRQIIKWLFGATSVGVVYIANRCRCLEGSHTAGALYGQQMHRPPWMGSQTRASVALWRRCEALQRASCQVVRPPCQPRSPHPRCQEGLLVRQGPAAVPAPAPQSISEQPALCSLDLQTGFERTAGGIFLMNWGFQRGDGKQAGREGSAALCEPAKQGLAHGNQPSPHRARLHRARWGQSGNRCKDQKADGVCQSLRYIHNIPDWSQWSEYHPVH